jgi:hypothetical protein
MTLAQLLSAPLPPLSELRGLWLVFDATLAARIADVQDERSVHKAAPIVLADGRFALCADMLSEVESGIYAAAFHKLDQSKFSQVEVLQQSEFQQLIPTTP